MRSLETPFQGPGRSDVFAANAMCATSHPAAALAAVEIMRAGGNAVDAGVAAAAVLCTAEPMMTGLAGDVWAMYAPPGWSSEQGPPIALNGSGRAPAALDRAALAAQFGDGDTFPLPRGSAHTVTVPGAVAGLCALHRDYGALGLGEVFAPGIAAAEQGVAVAPRTQFDWANNAQHLTGVARAYFLEGDAPFALGRLFRQPALGQILRRIAENGPSAFYEGEVADDMVASLRALGGSHTAADFAGAAPEYVTPIATTYRGAALWCPPPNGQGAVALLILDILSRFDLSGLAPFGADRLHLEAEAVARAYAARSAFLGDPGPNPAPSPLRDPALADRLAAEIDLERARPPQPVDTPKRPAPGDTVQISVVDAQGGALSLIMSIYDSFGSGLASERFGLLFHNRGGGFGLKDGHPNAAAPGKRPLHTLIPALLTEQGRPIMALGVMGGQYQAAGVARLISNRRDFGLGLQDAIDGPRSFAYGGALKVEAGIPEGVLETLSSRGHRLERADGPVGGAQAIEIGPSGVLRGGSDPRKDGCALGF